MADAGSDLVLVDRLRGGDPAALDELMARYAARVWRLARGVTRNDSDAEEVVQDVFLTLSQKSETFEGRSALGSWIYRITMNAALNKRRGKRAELEVSIEDMLPAYLADGHRAGDRAYVLMDWSRGPDAELLSSEARAVIRRTIDRLPDRYRVVLLMRDIEELSNEETAAALGETVSAVKSTLHRARMALREQLTRHYGGRP
jgi:RNA polymerase sigma-70 factor (ECF subfamily)